MPNTNRNALGVVFLLLLFLLGCSGSTNTPQPTDQTPPPAGNPESPDVSHLPPVPAPQPGVSMPTLPPDDFDVDNPDKLGSAVYRIFFRDTVNHQSHGRWSVTNTSGFKSWTLTNSYFSAPKAWQLGGNYWNREDDDLTSMSFDVDDGEDGLALTFYARWEIASDDHATVNYWDGGAWQQVVDFSGGTNPSYPGFDKYYFQLPANTSGFLQSCNVNAHFESNTFVNGFGIALDSVAVYQTQLAEPVNAQASDNDGSTYMTWDASTDPLIPDAYEIWRADSFAGDYELVDTTNDPVNNTQSANVSDAQCPDTNWYKARAIKEGWPPGPYSTPDEGCWNL